MTASLVEKIADAVLYEGYILYPYRPSAVKNQQRWNFGALCPQSYSLAQGGTESWTMQTECLVETGPATTLAIRVRFLHLLLREVGRIISDCRLAIADCGHGISSGSSGTSHYELVPVLEVNGRPLQSWQEAVERNVLLSDIRLQDHPEPMRVHFSFPASETIEHLHEEKSGETVGVFIRRQHEIAGAVEVAIQPASEGVQRVRVKILNMTPLEGAEQKSRDDALMRSFVSTHTILTVQNGEFVSQLDPPEPLRHVSAACSNVGTYPVLVGDEGSRDCMLSSPIILYDYPQIAPESAGSLYDGTEIDEILTLRIMTLTDEEKREMRNADERARLILERTETLPVEQLMKMHGAMKGVKS